MEISKIYGDNLASKYISKGAKKPFKAPQMHMEYIQCSTLGGPNGNF